MLLLDLDEIPQLARSLRLFGHNRRAVVSFRDADHLGERGRSTRDNLRAFVEQRGACWPGGPVRVLTHARVLGYVFNPVSFFYCHAPGEPEPALVVAEVHNTYGERHCYLLDARVDEAAAARDAAPGGDVQWGSPAEGADRLGRWRTKKVFHVSPFFSLDGSYAFALSAPAARLDVRIALEVRGETQFASRLRLERRPLTDATLAAMLVRYPLMTAQVIARIHWQALRLWLKGVPFRGKPPYDPARARRNTLA
jgi:DUF1365 family protein